MERRVCVTDQEKPCIIEFQAFRGNEDEFIVKELVIFDMVKCVTYTFFFKPPYNFNKLKTKAKITNNWLSRYFHNIEWNEGFISFDSLDGIMRHFCKMFNKIFTRGLEKAIWIKKYSTAKVYNIAIDKAFNIRYGALCSYARCNKHADSHCALKNAYNLHAFIQQEQSYSRLGEGEV